MRILWDGIDTHFADLRRDLANEGFIMDKSIQCWKETHLADFERDPKG